mmetsp:Transcript_25463/g.47423  ORF Transcript_25463/g.47423 Transcript_25463/m.47423 type:complete len:232 (+) Transcript_25463:488-1183(+)
MVRPVLLREGQRRPPHPHVRPSAVPIHRRVRPLRVGSLGRPPDVQLVPGRSARRRHTGAHGSSPRILLHAARLRRVRSGRRRPSVRVDAHGRPIARQHGKSHALVGIVHAVRPPTDGRGNGNVESVLLLRGVRGELRRRRVRGHFGDVHREGRGPGCVPSSQLPTYQLPAVQSLHGLQRAAVQRQGRDDLLRRRGVRSERSQSAERPGLVRPPVVLAHGRRSGEGGLRAGL